MFYPHPLGGLPWWQVAGAIAVLLAALTTLPVSFELQAPSAVFAGRLVVVFGYDGSHARVAANGRAGSRGSITYLPQIGLAIAVVWLAADLTADWRDRRPLVGLAAVSANCLGHRFVAADEALARRCCIIYACAGMHHAERGGSLQPWMCVEQSRALHGSCRAVSAGHGHQRPPQARVLAYNGETREKMAVWKRQWPLCR